VSLNSGSLVIPGHIFSVGVPYIWNILNIWSISESPLNNGPKFLKNVNYNLCFLILLIVKNSKNSKTNLNTEIKKLL
jgi:hypothetical protein